jgi:hypothetical protein
MTLRMITRYTLSVYLLKVSGSFYVLLRISLKIVGLSVKQMEEAMHSPSF